MRIVIVGGTRGMGETGFGSYAIVTGQRKRVTHLEFGSRMTPTEALTDTLMMALKTVQRQVNVRLEIQCTSPEFVAMLNNGRVLREQLAPFQAVEASVIPMHEARRQLR